MVQRLRVVQIMRRRQVSEDVSSRRPNRRRTPTLGLRSARGLSGKGDIWTALACLKANPKVKTTDGAFNHVSTNDCDVCLTEVGALGEYCFARRFGQGVDHAVTKIEGGGR